MVPEAPGWAEPRAAGPGRCPAGEAAPGSQPRPWRWPGRSIKTLLTVNILVFVGIVLFSAYCRLQGRAEGLGPVLRGAADRRARSRLPRAGARGDPGDREAILQRLDHLEEVVYHQLNGEPLGLGGRGVLSGARPLPWVPAADPALTPGYPMAHGLGWNFGDPGRQVGRAGLWAGSGLAPAAEGGV